MVFQGFTIEPFSISIKQNKAEKEACMEKRDTVGKLAHDQIIKDLGETKTPTYNEQSQDMLKEFIPRVLECVDIHKKKYPADFYVETITIEVPLMRGKVYRFKYLGKLACPTPTYDQTVFKYHKNDDRLEYLWTIPDRDTCAYLKNNALLIPPDQKKLLEFVLDDSSNDLLRRAKRLNGEEMESPLLVKG